MLCSFYSAFRDPELSRDNFIREPLRDQSGYFRFASLQLRLRWVPNTDSGWIDLASGVIYRRASGAVDKGKRRPPFLSRLVCYPIFVAGGA
jgi:hypothetical protein